MFLNFKVFWIASWIIILYGRPAHAITLSDVVAKILQMATAKFENDLKAKTEGAVVDLGPMTVVHHGNVDPSTDSPRWELYISYPYILWDPFSQYENIYKEMPMMCPLCTEDGFEQIILDRSGEWYNGRIKRLNPRIIYCTHTCTLLVSCCYKCSRGHQITACHPEILKTLKGKVDIPFFLTHKNGFTLDLAVLLGDLIDSGLSFEQVQNLIERQYKTTYDRFEKKFWRDLEECKKRGLIRDQTSFVFPKFSCENFPCPGNNVLIDIFLKQFFHDEQVYIDAMSSLSANIISCDHTFKSVCNIGYRRQEDGNWITQYNSIFCILNEKGEVMSWQFTKSESFPEVKEMFIEIKERFRTSNELKHICIDNCCKWHSLLREIFPETSVKQDLFHAVQRFVKTLKKRQPIQRDVAADFGKVFRDPRDIGDTRKMPTPGKDVLLSNLENFIKKWKNRETRSEVKILNPERWGVINNIRGHIIKGCLSDIPVHCSTSINERLHKDMKKLLANNRMGTQLAYAKFSRYFFRHNQLRGNQESIHSIRTNMEQGTFKDINTGFISRNVPFGIRPKDREIAGIPSVSKQPESQRKIMYTIDEITPAVVDDAIKKIKAAGTFNEGQGEPESMQSSLPDHIYSCSIPNETDKNLIAVLDYSLSIYKVVLMLKKLWSSKSENILKIPFLFQNFKTYLSSGTSNVDPMENAAVMNDVEDDRLQNLASSFGFSIVQVSGDGNCFFTAVAFQLSQILSSPSCPDIVRSHMQNYGIENHVNVEQIRTRLRELIVNEWQENELDYNSFFGGIDIYTESERFRNSGEFAGQLGDAMPLAIANVLNMPIYILTTVHNIPFLSVFPRSSMNGDTGIFLSYNQEGPGHYDALVFQASQRTADIVEHGHGSDSLLQQEENNANVNEAVSNERVTCRCGANQRNLSNKGSTRVYNSHRRCKCAKQNTQCNTWCNCHGMCGGKKCGGSPRESLKRVGRKRSFHEMQEIKTYDSSKSFMDSKNEKIKKGKLNIVEYVVVCAIILYLEAIGAGKAMSDIKQLYDAIVSFVHLQEILLPLTTQSMDAIERTVKKAYAVRKTMK